MQACLLLSLEEEACIQVHPELREVVLRERGELRWAEGGEGGDVGMEGGEDHAWACVQTSLHSSSC
jgi:hypothetical protein